MFLNIFLVILSLFLSDTAISKTKTKSKTKQSIAKKEKVLSAKLDICGAPFSLLIEGETGKVLFERESQTLMHPASITKMMTAYIVMEQLKAGILKPDTLFTVGKNAFRVEGSTSFLEKGEQVSVLHLLKGLIIHSGNDTAVVLAESIAGTESAFAEMMNKKAEELGMTNTHFLNASGLPDTEHQSTAQDLLILAKRLREDFPEYYLLWAEKEFVFKGIKQQNRNPLLYKNMGCDGLKTGSSSVSGFGVVVSCKQNNRTLYAITNGSKTMQKRANDITDLVNYGFNTFFTYKLFEKKHVLDQIPVWYGSTNRVRIGFNDAVIFTDKKFDQRLIKVSFEYEKVLKAPVKQGTVVGKAMIELPITKEKIEKQIVCLEDIEETNFMGKVYDGLVHMFGGRVYSQNFINQKMLHEKSVK